MRGCSRISLVVGDYNSVIRDMGISCTGYGFGVLGMGNKEQGGRNIGKTRHCLSIDGDVSLQLIARHVSSRKEDDSGCILRLCGSQK